MFGLGFTEILVILCVALIVLGPKRLPEVARTLGRTVASFRRTMDDLHREVSFTSLDRQDDPPAVTPHITPATEQQTETTKATKDPKEA
jgi:Tat protein translocase TatB subunit